MSNKLLKMLAIQAATCAYASNGYRMYDRPQKFETLPLSKILRPQPVQLHKFNIKGVEIEARSRKDAIKRYNHLKKK